MKDIQRRAMPHYWAIQYPIPVKTLFVSCNLFSGDTMKSKLALLSFLLLILLPFDGSVFGQENIIQLPTTLELSRFAYDARFADYVFPS